MPRPKTVQHFLPSLGHRDAVGNHTFRMKSALAEVGVKGSVWAEHIHPSMANTAKPFERFESSKAARRGANALLYQSSAGSGGMVEALIGRPEPKAVYYHNITPAGFFEQYDPSAAVNLSIGRDELKAVVYAADLVMANSEYSAQEVRDLGVGEVTVIPPYLLSDVHVNPSASHVDWLRRTKESFDILFVSRVAPHKGHIALLRAFAALIAAVDARARLFVVGAWGPTAYIDAVFRVRDLLKLERVAFTGSITAERLAAFYQECDVFLCLSEHEGYGLPLIEAMRRDVPVVALDAAAVAETMSGAGVLLRNGDPAFVAEVVGHVATDSSLRDEIVVGQRGRLASLDAIDRDAAVVEAVGRITV